MNLVSSLNLLNAVKFAASIYSAQLIIRGTKRCVSVVATDIMEESKMMKTFEIVQNYLCYRDSHEKLENAKWAASDLAIGSFFMLAPSLWSGISWTAIRKTAQFSALTFSSGLLINGSKRASTLIRNAVTADKSESSPTSSKTLSILQQYFCLSNPGTYKRATAEMSLGLGLMIALMAPSRFAALPATCANAARFAATRFCANLVITGTNRAITCFVENKKIDQYLESEIGKRYFYISGHRSHARAAAEAVAGIAGMVLLGV